MILFMGLRIFLGGAQSPHNHPTELAAAAGRICTSDRGGRLQGRQDSVSMIVFLETHILVFSLMNVILVCFSPFRLIKIVGIPVCISCGGYLDSKAYMKTNLPFGSLPEMYNGHV